MKTDLALFRGINVGGNNLLPMKELKALLEKLGSEKVKTYIQSGNAVFQHKAGSASVLAKKISLYAPDGVGRSKLAARAEKALGVAATARNWPTVLAIMDLTKQ